MSWMAKMEGVVKKEPRMFLKRRERYRSMSSLMSHNSSASHQRFTAFLVRFAGGEVIAGREGASGGVGGDIGGADWDGGGWQVSCRKICGGYWAPALVVFFTFTSFSNL